MQGAYTFKMGGMDVYIDATECREWRERSENRYMRENEINQISLPQSHN